jgi:hypothetical protein
MITLEGETMTGFETFKYSDKDQRNNYFEEMKTSSFSLPNERQVIRWSDVEPVMASEEEFQLDNRGRVVYQSVFFLSYPKDIHGRRVRARAEREEKANAL